jgi:hypothetical protein
MPIIKPVSDLRDYLSVLEGVSEGSPLFLTKNGRGRYAIVDIKDQENYGKTKAALMLMCELEKEEDQVKKMGGFWKLK